MNKLDLSEKNNEVHYLYGEIAKLRKSTDQHLKMIFSLVDELQSQIIIIKEKDGKRV